MRQHIAKGSMTTISLGADDVRAAVSTEDAIEAVREALLDLAAGHFEQPVRTAMRDGRFLIMSTHHRPTATAMVKTLSLDFNRVPAIAGTVTWAEIRQPETLVADAAAITGLRTGAICGVATDLLAAADADTMAIIGAGGQAPDQVRAVHAVRPLRKLSVADRDRSRATALADALAPELPHVEIEVAGSVDAAVSEAHVVTCATPATEPVLASGMLRPRVHVNAIGAFRPTMRELPDDLLAEATVVIDDLEAILEESGEILHALGSGAIVRNDLTVLGDALSRAPEPRERTVFKTVGVAAQDWAIARLLASKFLPAAQPV
jgi:ornithine cyclodeaminase/alanine dehydrogenase-like protein (mu-crystallin family)